MQTRIIHLEDIEGELMAVEADKNNYLEQEMEIIRLNKLLEQKQKEEKKEPNIDSHI